MPINSQHAQYKENIAKWELIDNVVDIDNVEQYLIELNPNDNSAENTARNKAYRERAVFYALASQTVAGFIGTVFEVPPDVDVPAQLEYINDNIDGSGNSIQQQAQLVTRNIVSKSRDGLYVSFPKVDGAITRADVVNGTYVASINQIDAKRIVNWARRSIGSKNVLSLVVFQDFEQESKDGYEIKDVEVYRELFLDDANIYNERIWRKPDGSDKWVADEPTMPKDAKGNPWKEIPFTFVGASNNDATVDSPNLYGICKLNISHYRNSADYEDSIWFAGQAQPWMSGVDQDHIDLMNANNMYVGSRNLIAVPDGGQFGFAAAPPNPAVRQSMLDKQDMMIGLGARMITPGGVAKTAEQSANERKTQHSTLSLMAMNISEAYTKCIYWMSTYMGIEEDVDMKFELNTDFIDSESTSAELREIIAGFVQGVIPQYDYIRYMKDYGVFDEDKDDDDYVEELDSSGSLNTSGAIGLPGSDIASNSNGAGE